MVEVYFTIEASKQAHKTQKVGRGSKTKFNVMIMAESTINTNSIDDEQTIVFTNKSTSYVNIADYEEIHVTEKSSEQTTKETLKWVPIAISNAKRSFVGTNHRIKKEYLQLCLNEFVYKLNLRYFGEQIFDGLIIASITVQGH